MIRHALFFYCLSTSLLTHAHPNFALEQHPEQITHTLYISEFSADTDNTFTDEDGDDSDWIELHNPTQTALNLRGFFFTDDASNKYKWPFPDVNIGPNAYMIIFASGKDRADINGILHTNFKLDKDGEYLALIHSDSTSILSEFSPQYPQQYAGITYGISTDGNYYYCTPTPGTENQITTLGILETPTVNRTRGIYTNPFELTIHSSDPNASIIYTLDGSAPSQGNGSVYTGPIDIDQTRVVRFFAYREGYQSSPIATHTYLFPKNVVDQPEMDHEITRDSRYANKMVDALTSLPSLSVSIDPDSLHGPSGIYTNPAEKGRAWERAASIEYIPPDAQDFQVNAGIRIHGGASRQSYNSPKHSFRLTFRSEYGASSLNYPLFNDTPMTRFNSLILRAGYSDTWIIKTESSRSKALLLRDSWVRKTYNEMGQLTAHDRFVHLYLNGTYWGVYDLCERQDETFFASYLDTDKDNFEVYERDDFFGDAWNEVIIEDYLRLLQLTAYQGTVSSSNYEEVSQILCLENFVDYLIINHFSGNLDWMDNNICMWRDTTADNHFRFSSWDNEVSLFSVNENITTQDVAYRPSWIYTYLRTNFEFRFLFQDRIYKHFFNTTVFDPDKNIARFEKLAEQVETALIAESARWGDYRRDVSQWETGPFELYTVEDHWIPEKNRLINEYFPKRTDIVLNDYINLGLFSYTDVPQFSQHGGTVEYGFQLTLSSNSGSIYYTIDGSDPRKSGGTISEKALRYNGNPITLTNDITIKCRSKQGNSWSALNDVQFDVGSGVPATQANLIINEINYHPLNQNPSEADDLFSEEDFEFIEIKNLSDEQVSLEGLEFTKGIAFSFDDGQIHTLGPAGFILIVKNREAFLHRYGESTLIAGEYDGNLSNGGEKINLTNDADDVLIALEYSDSQDWPQRADGWGSTLEFIGGNTDDIDDPQNWRASERLHGTPGYEEAGDSKNNVVINELLLSPESPLCDAIELYNSAASPRSLDNLYIGSPDDFKRYKIPSNSTIPESGYLVFSSTDGWVKPDSLPTAIYLLEADDNGQIVRFLDEFACFTPKQNESIGRYPNGSGTVWPMETQTLLDQTGQKDGKPNEGVRTGPVVLYEIMYHPPEADDQFEYLILRNNGVEAEDLSNWKISGGITYTFPDNCLLDPETYIIITPFGPSDSTLHSEFCSFYTICSSMTTYGPWEGHLSNAGESLYLYRYHGGAESHFMYTLEDYLSYDDAAPWPDLADGEGASLRKIDPLTYSGDPGNWDACSNPLNSIVTDVSDKPGTLPSSFTLHQNYPNPFNGTTTIQIDLPESSPLTVTILNTLGQTIRTLADGPHPAGRYFLTWDGKDAQGCLQASGIYFCRVRMGKKLVETQRIVLLK